MWCFHASRTTTCCGYEVVNEISELGDETDIHCPHHASRLRLAVGN